MAVGAYPNLKHRTLMVAGMAGVIILGMAVSQVWQTYKTTVAVARRDIEQLSQILEANTDVTFQSAEMVIDHSIEEFFDAERGPKDGPKLTDRFVNIADKWPFIYSVGFINPQGKLSSVAIREADGKLSPLDAESLVDMSREPLFVAHSEAAAENVRAFYIARPGRDVISGEWVIALSKAVRDEEGRFRGVNIVTVGLETFTNVYAGLLPARFSSIEIYRGDGVRLVSTVPNRPRELTGSEQDLFKDKVPLASAGVYRVTSKTGDRETVDDLFAYRVLQRYPVVVSATAEWDRVLDRWRAASFVTAALALFGVMVIAALTGWLIRRIAAEQTAQRAVAVSERSLMESQRLSGIGYFERPVHSQEVVWSPLMYAIHGVDPATFTPTRAAFRAMVVPEDQAQLDASWAASDSRQAMSDVEYRVLAPDNTLRHIRYAWKIIDDGAGPPRMFGVAQDVTAMRRAESIIREDEERMRDIVECSSDYIWEVDDKGVVRLFSGPGAGVSGDDPRGRTISPAHYIADSEDSDRERVREYVAKREKFRSLLIPVRDEEGEVRWLRVSGNPRFDAKGRFLGYRGAGSDVTELRRREAQDEASRKAEALGRLASGLAHEINNLLQPIVIYANFGVSQRDLAANIRQYFAHIGRAAERSIQIVRNVLAYARQSPPRRENVAVDEVVRETVEFMAAALEPGIVLEMRGVDGDAPDGLCARVDRTGLGQVLTNLLSNAAEAVPAHGGRIGIAMRIIALGADAAAEQALAPGVYCCLEVEDNGHGIPAEQIGQVFDPFFTTKPQGKGTGLGLSVVAGLVRSWDGAVTVESAPGVRTVFKVYLPLAERHLQAAQ
jgi:PAS domain S-box-containing protein